jgi:hypothetical protein
MKTRPTSVSIIAWFLIITGCISLVSTTVMIMIGNPEINELMSKNLMPISLQYAIAYLGLAIMLVSGAYMLKGENWSRRLYVAWSIIGFAIGIVTSPMKMAMIPSLVLFLIIVFFLFRPKANDFFSPPESQNNAQNI